jgi:hypothetical protein
MTIANFEVKNNKSNEVSSLMQSNEKLSKNDKGKSSVTIFTDSNVVKDEQILIRKENQKPRTSLRKMEPNTSNNFTFEKVLLNLNSKSRKAS